MLDTDVTLLVQGLEKGTRLTKESKKRIEERYYRVRMESRQIVVMNEKGKEDICIDIGDIKEIRSGRAIRELDRYEGTPPKNHMFSIYYGDRFVLKTVTFVASNYSDYNMWMQGLRYLVQDNSKKSYHATVERWLWKHYFQLARRVDEKGQSNASSNDLDPDSKTSRGDSPASESWGSPLGSASSLPDGSASTVSSTQALYQKELKLSPKDLKLWLTRVHSKMAVSLIKSKFSSNVSPKPNYVDFRGFQMVYSYITFNNKFYLKQIKPLVQPGDTDESKRISIQEFWHFLAISQKERFFSESEIASVRLKRARDVMVKFLDDPSREDLPNLSLEPAELVDYLFSDINSVLNPYVNEVYQDMTRPLSEYWIASSHNTYLTGDQFASESSCEAYARALKMGCRCIELDCWNGDVEPIIYHGRTLTSKIKLRHVLNTIKEYAWVASEYPLILSIENHCDVQQQRIMAQFMVETFQDNLLKNVDVLNDEKLPSPEDLKRKIILKHKKLPIEACSGSGDNSSGIATGGTGGDESIDDSILNTLYSGRLYMIDPVFKNWVAYFAVLTKDNKIVYTEDTGQSHKLEEEPPVTTRRLSTDSPEGLEEVGSRLMNGGMPEVDADESLRRCRWYQGRLERNVAADWIMMHWYLGDGAFMVRHSETFPTDFSLSFYRSNHVYHVRILAEQNTDTGEVAYSFENTPLTFPTMKKLIHHYQKSDIVSDDFRIRLGDPVPRRYHNESWFHTDMSREAAERMLSLVRLDGAFLVRTGVCKVEKQAPDTKEHIVLSFRARDEIHHCPIIYDSYHYSIGGANFSSLVSLVDYYRQHRIYLQIRLRYPVNMEMIERLGVSMDSQLQFDGSNSQYIDLSHLKQERQLKLTRFVAKYDYFPPDLENLSFTKGSVITNVRRIEDNDSLMIGDYQGQRNKTFPSYLVEEVCLEDIQESEVDLLSTCPVTDADLNGGSPLGNLEMGCIELLHSTTVQFRNNSSDKPSFRLIMGSSFYDLAFDTEFERSEWVNAIQQCLSVKEKQAQACEQMEKMMRISKHLSDLIVYCRSVPFCWQRLTSPCYEMSSFPELKFEKLILDKNTKVVDRSKMDKMSKYLTTHLGRVYPKGTRLDSSNFDPLFAWSIGVQMVALNYQTGDRSMQLNQGRFLDNGQCGYVLKRDCGLQSTLVPSHNTSLTEQRYRNGPGSRSFIGGSAPGADSLHPLHACPPPVSKGPESGSAGLGMEIKLEILSGRHLPKVAKACLEVEIAGTLFERNVKYRTPVKGDVNLNVTWHHSVVFTVLQPASSLIRLAYCSEDKFGDNSLLGQAVFPVSALRPGIRSVALKNGYGERIEMATLLLRLTITTGVNIGGQMYRKFSDGVKSISIRRTQSTPATAQPLLTGRPW